MKKISLLLLLIVGIYSTFAQAQAQADEGEWIINDIEGDELLNQEAYTQYGYKTNKEDVVIFEMKKEPYIIFINNNNPFRYKSVDLDGIINASMVIIGMYDIDNNLIDKIETLIVVDKDRQNTAGIVDAEKNTKCQIKTYYID